MLCFFAMLLLPVLAGALLPLLRFRSPRARAVYVTLAVLGTSALALVNLLTQRDRLFPVGELLPGLAIAFRLDGKAAVFTALAAFLWPFSSLYAFSYMEHEARPNRFFAWYTMAFGVTLALAASANLFTLYLFYECLTLVTLPLVNHKDDAASRRAGVSYAAWTMGGAALGFIALMVSVAFGGESALFAPGGVLDASRIAGHETVLRIVFLLGFIGFGAKAAVIPFQHWLPQASVAPTPVTALLHAVAVVNAGAFAVIRLIFDVFGTALLSGTFAQSAALSLACATVVLGSVMAVREQHLKRRLAWSTVSNLSYMLMGAALMTPEGQTGALTHLVFHGLMKITLFFCAGAIQVKAGKEYVQEMRGLGQAMPVTCGVFLYAGTALVGTPLLCGFVSKWNLLTAAGALGGWMGILSIASLIVSTVLTAVYVLEPAIVMLLRPRRPEDSPLPDRTGDPDARMLLPMLLFCLLMLAGGLWSAPLVSFLRTL
ncbi:MAG: proton-conducting membrane transporter [Clostridia bacterium]|nr:proton-conducting membrane transporter [Clostridia bacterium]